MIFTPNKKCDFCGKMIYVQPWKQKLYNYNFCDKKCQHGWQRIRMTGSGNHMYEGKLIDLVCKVCGKTFQKTKRDSQYKSKICSRACANLYYVGENANSYGKVMPKSGDIVKCLTCGKEFYSYKSQHKKFCNRECYAKQIPINMKGDKNSSWKGGKSFELYSIIWTHEFKTEIRQRDNFTCLMCGKRGYHVHHIDYDKKNNNKLNLITLCSSCHASTNHHRYFWESFFKYNIAS